MRICFVCLGNICRSPMAEFILKDLLKKNNIDDIIVESRATSYEEEGNDMYYLAKEELTKRGIPFTRREASTLNKNDYDKYDLIVGMDDGNIRNIMRIIGEDPKNKVYKLNRFSGSDEDIKDPWYTRDFDAAYNDIFDGVKGLLKIIKK